MVRHGLTVALLLVMACRADEESGPQFGDEGAAFLKKWCAECHSGGKAQAGFRVDQTFSTTDLLKQRKAWLHALNRMAADEMPPKDKPRPSIEQVNGFTRLVTSIFGHHDRNAKPDPGRVTMRRLNQFEYRNTVRDLTGVDFDPSGDFPSDQIGHGFDNIGDVLSVSPVLMERYLAAAEQIMEQAIMPVPPPVIKRHLKSIYTEPASAVSGKLVVNGFRPMTTDGKEVIETGAVNTPYKWEPTADYMFRTRVYAERGDGGPLRVSILVYGKELQSPDPESKLNHLSGRVQKPAKILKTFPVTARSAEDAQMLEVKVPAMHGRHRMMIAIDKPAPGRPAATLWVEYLALDGPLDPRPASHRMLLASSAGSQLARTREVMARFLRRAFRRTPAPAEIERVEQMVSDAMKDGESWEAGIQFAMTAVLCSPKFLFRMELDRDPQDSRVTPLDEFQLAARLSYFLWGSMPDDVLLDLAERNQLRKKLDAQVERMLADARSAALVDSFAMQWLQLQRIDFISPDGRLFPTFNAALRQAMVEETRQFVSSVIEEDSSLVTLIDADYTFVNRDLARLYGISDTAGNPVGQPPVAKGRPIPAKEFVRVPVRDPNRGGLLTQAAVLAVTSNPTRTSPVKRGKWVLEQILGEPPPPPPADVAELSEEAKVVSSASLRERLEQHRTNPACANCHSRMDALGFALENFDAVGGWRTKDGEFEIDPGGQLADGTQLTGAAGLKTLIRSRRNAFVRCLTEKLMTYALGRGIEFYDRPAVDRVVEQITDENDRFSMLIKAIVRSDAFQKRRGI